MSRKRNNKSQRFFKGTIHISESNRTITAHYNNNKQTVEFSDSFGNPVDFNEGIEKCYKGMNKEKKEVKFFTRIIPLDDSNIFSNFEMVYSVDTNYKQIGDTITAVGVLINWDINYIEGCVQVNHLMLDCFPDCWKNIYKMKYENYMWSDFLSILRGEDKSYNKKSLLIVDSDLDNLSVYNNHQEPFYSGSFLPCQQAVTILPDNYIFYYAKGDASSESILNIMIKCCDYISSQILNSLENTTLMGNKEEQRDILLSKFKEFNNQDIISSYVEKFIKNIKRIQ